VQQVLALAREVLDRPGFDLVGVMTYEGQVAGVPDDVPRRHARSLVVRRLKSASVHQLDERRREIAEALRGQVELGFWNAGGSGSVESSVAHPAVTEVSAGSGLLVPHLFDHYRGFEPRPAAFFGLRVGRRPARETVTVAGGGLIASGPSGMDRALFGPAASALQIGDLVWFRHAKSGELAEHTPRVYLLSDGEIVDTAATYRGTGNAW